MLNKHCSQKTTEQGSPKKASSAKDKSVSEGELKPIMRKLIPDTGAFRKNGF